MVYGMVLDMVRFIISAHLYEALRGRLAVKKIVAVLIMLFSMGVALIAFAQDDPEQGMPGATLKCKADMDLCRYRFYMNSGDYEKALDAAEDAAVKHPGSGSVWYRKARVLHKLDEKVLAVDAYETAMENGYASFYALNNVGLLYMQLGHNEKAVEKLEAAVAMDDAQACGFGNLGTVYQRMGQLEKARTAYQAAVDMDPDYALATARLKDIKARLARKVVKTGN